MKCHQDLIKCSQIPEETEICFLDDKFHQGMIHDKVYYINIKPYYYDLSFDEMIERFVKSGIISETKEKETKEKESDIKSYLFSFLKRFNYTFTKKTKEAQNLDKILSKKIMHHLHIFFLEKEKEKEEPRKNQSKTQKIYKTSKPKKNDRKKSVKKR
jgi:meiotically up-regulated gene 157 (Mug157) protein